MVDVTVTEVGPLEMEEEEEAEEVMGTTEVELVGGIGMVDVELEVVFTGGVTAVGDVEDELELPGSAGARGGKMPSKMPASARESSMTVARSNSVVRKCIFFACWFLLMAGIAVDVEWFGVGCLCVFQALTRQQNKYGGKGKSEVCGLSNPGNRESRDSAGLI